MCEMVRVEGEQGKEIKLERVVGFGWSFLVPSWDNN